MHFAIDMWIKKTFIKHPYETLSRVSAAQSYFKLNFLSYQSNVVKYISK